MQINKAALEIFDFTSSLAVYSEHELNVGDEHIQEYIGAHVVKAFRDPSARTGLLQVGNPMRQRIEAYQLGNTSFVSLAKDIGERAFDYMKQATDGMVIDTIICEAHMETDYLCILLCQAHHAFTHQLFSEDDGSLTTELIPHKAVLPMPSQKLRSFVAINMKDFSVKLFEPKGEFDGEVSYILADKVLQLVTEQSSRDTVKKVKSIIDKVAKAHESDGVEEMTQAKSMIAKNAEVSDTVNPLRIVEEVFKANPIQQEAAKKELVEQDMMRPLPVNREFATKVGEHHKIKTDTGIEISFPVEYMKNREFIEIKQNEDGMLRIELKNINKIINK
ncbi:nucleoid-associated protein [Veillonella agrestimuris]|uniref:nucleoid-associated protein n=1 Tax=Veillonella agrestimuris TaxID=2941340 RepID=UPI00203DA8B7|nr:nucleoid-associated protein [Veillonella agrestimuris]